MPPPRLQFAHAAVGIEKWTAASSAFDEERQFGLPDPVAWREMTCNRDMPYLGPEWTINLVLASAFSGLGAFSFGFDNGWWGGVLGERIFNQLYGSIETVNADGSITRTLSASEQSNGTGLGTAGIMLGNMAAPFINKKFGRKGGMWAVAIVGIVGGIIEACSAIPHSYYMLVAGKIIMNASVGIASASAPAYQAEIAPARIRGALINFYAVINTLGGAIAVAVIWAVNERDDEGAFLIPICLQFLPAIAIISGIWWMPESPRWLVEAGREEEAVAAIRTLRGAEVDARAEVAEIRAGFESEKLLYAGIQWGQLWQGANLRRTLISIGVQCLQQAQGISFMNNYLLVTFQSLGFTEVYALSFGVYLVQGAGSCAGFVLPDKFGRRKLLLTGAAFLLSCQLIVAAIATVQETPAGSLANLLIASCFIWVAAFGASWGTLPWIVSAEISSQMLREKSLALGAWSGYGVGLISNFVTPYIQNAEYGNLGAKISWMWAGFSLVSIIYVYVMVPELKGRTLEELDQLFEARISPRKFGKHQLNAPLEGETAAEQGKREKEVVVGTERHLE
ncbi:general substrate transporter [Leucosporidium creatinivorum]|uniref:General substrate transporter n=1 Tax=Leucosporidium creatinivorum TaxID=106004 RepID=A0A1Y2G005_9BASI|nr:general substrate transporter [Leucosporidium creatinivorum]